jgi:AcrR family transcriptional regulator
MREERHRDRRRDHRPDVAARHTARRERRHRETHDEILAAAREVLLERGAADLSLREIARRAGFSPGALYKYFDSKDDVIRALADKAMGTLLTAFERVPADLPAAERAVELGMAFLEYARHNPEDVAVITLHESMPEAPLSHEHAGVEQTVVGVFRQGAAEGVFILPTPEDADFMAYGAWALVQGLATLEQRQRPAIAARLRAKQRRLLQAYVNGLKSDWSAQK